MNQKEIIITGNDIEDINFSELNKKEESKILRSQIQKEARKKTQEKRTHQKVMTIECKIQENKLSTTQKENLSSLFILSKNFYNYSLSKLNNLYETEEKDEIIEEKVDVKKTKQYIKNGKLKAGEKVFYKKFKKIIKDKKGYYTKTSDTQKGLEKLKEIIILNKDKVEEKRDISLLHSQIKQSLLTRMNNSIKGLGVSKKKGRKVGKLKFKSKLTSIDLKQYNTTHKVINQDTIQISKIGNLKVNGLHQLSGYSDIEFANAKLIQKASGYYFHLTFFVPKVTHISHNNGNTIYGGVNYNTGDHLGNKEIGIDFGIKDQLVLSNGVRFNFQIPESKRLKKLQKKYARKVNTQKRLGIITNKEQQKVKSNNGYKLKCQISKAHEKIVNQRTQIRKKLLCYLKRFDRVVIQDEMIKSWHSRGGKSKSSSFGRGGLSKKVQYSGIGGIIGEIKTLPTHILIETKEPTTQICSCCGHQQKLILGERVFQCEHCGYTLDRDANSSFNILQIGTHTQIPVERRKFTPLEIHTSMLLENKSIYKTIEEFVDKRTSIGSLMKETIGL